MPAPHLLPMRLLSGGGGHAAAQSTKERPAGLLARQRGMLGLHSIPQPLLAFHDASWLIKEGQVHAPPTPVKPQDISCHLLKSS